MHVSLSLFKGGSTSVSTEKSIIKFPQKPTKEYFVLIISNSIIMQTNWGNFEPIMLYVNYI